MTYSSKRRIRIRNDVFVNHDPTPSLTSTDNTSVNAPLVSNTAISNRPVREVADKSVKSQYRTSLRTEEMYCKPRQFILINTEVQAEQFQNMFSYN